MKSLFSIKTLNNHIVTPPHTQATLGLWGQGYDYDCINATQNLTQGGGTNNTKPNSTAGDVQKTRARLRWWKTQPPKSPSYHGRKMIVCP